MASYVVVEKRGRVALWKAEQIGGVGAHGASVPSARWSSSSAVGQWPLDYPTHPVLPMSIFFNPLCRVASMRVTGPLLKVLAALLDDSQLGTDSYGLDLSRRTGIKSGTLYPVLDRLEDAGWVRARWEGIEPTKAGRPRRRLYRLTGTGAHEACQTLTEHTRVTTILPADGLPPGSQRQ